MTDYETVTLNDGRVIPRSALDKIASGGAPRLAAGWAALLRLLADGRPHTRAECVGAFVETGLVPKTGANLLNEGVRAGRLTKIGSGAYARYAVVR